MTTCRLDNRLRSRVKPALCVLLAFPLLLAGCRVGPVYQRPAATTQAPPTAYKEATGPAQIAAGNQNEPTVGGWKVADPAAAMLRGKWWEIYKEPELNALEEQVNVNNQSIQQSYQDYMQARALIAQARAQLYPTLSTAPSWQRSRTSSNTRDTSSAATANSTAAANTASTTTSLTTLPLTASWEPDLWGKVRNAIRADQASAQLSAADLEDVRLTEQASLAIDYFELRGQDSLIQLYKDTVSADQKTLELAQASYETGVGQQIAVVEAEATLENAQSALTNLGVARAQYEHAIATLIGTPASAFSLPVAPLITAIPSIPIGVPSQLLERRPDIAASERAMAAANAQIGVAVAAFYPNLTLSLEGGLESSTFKHLFDIPSRFWSIGPSVSETLFDAGLRRATVNQYIATYNADVASYRQTVLSAFEQVEDDLASVRILSEQIAQQEKAVESTRHYLELETARYETGIDTYATLISVRTNLLAQQQTLASLKTEQITASVQLIEALGGGWDRSQLPTTDQVSAKLIKAESAIQK